MKKIIILGAGQVGSSVAFYLSSEDNDITLVDTDAATLEKIQNRLDINTVIGVASNPAVLRQAGAEHADLILAVTSSDETNMIACQVAFTMFQTPTKIARLRSKAYLGEKILFRQESLPIDNLISPEELVKDYILNLIKYPGSLKIINFNKGEVNFAKVKIYSKSPLVGKKIKEIGQYIDDKPINILAIYRHNREIIPENETSIRVDDEVFFICKNLYLEFILSRLCQNTKKPKSIIIAGGGHIGETLCLDLEKNYQVKIIEKNMSRTRDLAKKLTKTTVLNGDASDYELLNDEDINSSDLFIALTSRDETNILSAMLAKKIGCNKVISLISNQHYLKLMDNSTINIPFSPQQITIGSLLKHIRRIDVVSCHALKNGEAEILEVIIHGDKLTSKIIEQKIKNIKTKLPDKTSIAAIIRNTKMIMPDDDEILQDQDHLIIFLMDKNQINNLEKLLQVRVLFI
ncbi:MAG: Trk system potassium transporter TrkA [Gammaproteobacteria bacterium]|nr:MAG: Trk system potassium transporter TrkA [Gammaproteobacteria bacterium]